MKTVSLLFGLFLICALVVAVPIAIIWSLNTLFPVLEIPVNLKTWLAMFILNVLVIGKSGLK